jgi:hypothetical protein
MRPKLKAAADHEAAFHIPTEGRCKCPGCVEATKEGPICQSCHERWPCSTAREHQGESDGT